MQIKDEYLIELAQIDRLRRVNLKGKPLLIHDHHRWNLPLIFAAQEARLLPTPCVWVMFDHHRDDLEPHDLVYLSELRPNLSFDSLIEVCSHRLRSLNDDWVKAGMELGLISDIIVFGAEGGFEADKTFKDSLGTVHRLFFCYLPKSEMEYQGQLSDYAKQARLQSLWDVLGWDPRQRFQTGKPAIGLDFDLDCFVMQWKDYAIPWVPEVCDSEFDMASSYFSTEGLTGAWFIRQLVNKAGIVVVDREPLCCGGEEKSDEVLAILNKHVFDGISL